MTGITEGTYEKLKILADSAKFDVSCSTSGTARKNNGRIGNAQMAGCCHSWSADGRCISLLKVLFTNDCVYNCEYCVNRRSADCRRAAFEPAELAALTIEFYKRNYIEGLFLSSAVAVSPDHTSERILASLRMLRRDFGFAGYIHAKIIPGTSPELVHAIGLEADRLSVNAELPCRSSLERLAPQKKPEHIFTPMKQITNTLIDRQALRGPGTMFKGLDINSGDSYLSSGAYGRDSDPLSPGGDLIPRPHKRIKESFAPAGQTTQMIIGASGETDQQIMKVSEKIYHTFKMKRVYFSAYIPMTDSPLLPGRNTSPPLAREHRLYQADWLLRFYGFSSDELFDERHPDLDPDLDPKITWALRNLHMFPMEVNRAGMNELLRIPGLGTLSALRIIRQRRICTVRYEDLKKMGVVLKRARHFLTCSGHYYGCTDFTPESIKNEILQADGGVQLSMFDTAAENMSTIYQLSGLKVPGIPAAPSQKAGGTV